ncbi:helix-turn-helix domain-containing protein [Clostridium tepidum]|uniref:helix-turn-helix domain-containing protein n=1 Tax=Clostridium tepidum TaxID=1962263 RepID=UPI00098FB80B|nr:helix-turn-helix transcriptional regulator [Clostridium tepidum]
MQEDLRQRLINYCTKNGTKYVFVAKKIGISKSLVSKFIHNKYILRQETVEKLEKLLM